MVSHNQWVGGVLKKKIKIKCTNRQTDQGYGVLRDVVIKGHNIRKS
jgi:hypothetical protein